MPGTLTISTLSDGTNSTSATNCIQGSAKAWVRFTVSGTTPTINGSYNVSSITYVAGGQFTITFTTAMPNASYNAVGGGSINTSLNAYCSPMIFAQAASPYALAPTTTSMSVLFTNFSANQNPYYGNITVFA